MEKIRKVHLDKINKMLMAMAKGDFFYRLERTGTNDNVEAMTLVLNMLAEEIQETLVNGGFVNSNGVTKNLVQMSFLLDPKGMIQLVNQHACSVLAYLHKELIGKRFKDFLDSNSQKQWKKVVKSANKKSFYDTAVELAFLSRDGLLIPHTCYISSCLGSPKVPSNLMVTVVLHSKDRTERDERQRQDVFRHKKQGMLSNKESTEPVKNSPRLSFEDIRKIRQGHQKILNNLEEELPSLKEFAHQLGTNEFKLKFGFKQLFGTTVYRFLLQERLRKSKMLIQHTDSPIKTIAYKTGFKSIPHFSRVFKKTYGYAPSELRKLGRKDL